jgi:hypothetical protein
MTIARGVTMRDAIVTTMIDMVYRRGPGDDPYQREQLIGEWVNGLTEADALELVDWVGSYMRDSSRYQPPEKWAPEIGDSACYYVGIVGSRTNSEPLRVRLEALLANESLRYSALLGIEQLGSPLSLDALESYLNDPSFQVIDQIGTTLAAIKSPRSILMLKSMIGNYPPGSMESKSLSQTLRECGASP